jgi:predicted XRE-type DNA-binding protein
MADHVFRDVWDALEPDPAIAANMRLRSALIIAITQFIQEKGLSQAEAAKLFGCAQPRISDLVRGKINLFSLDMLVAMLASAGIEVDMTISKRRADKAVRKPAAVAAKAQKSRSGRRASAA